MKRSAKAPRGTRKDSERMQFASWLVLPPSQRKPATQDELAKHLGVAASTLSAWRRLPLIQAVTADWRASYKVHFSEVMDAMFRKARNGNVAAARLLAEVFGELSPTKSEVSIDEVSVTYTKPEALRDYAKGVLQASEAKAEQKVRDDN